MSEEQTQHVAIAVVTLDTIYSLLLETRDDVRDIKAELSNLTDDSKDHEERLRSLEQIGDKRVADHETRLRSVERRIWWAMGAAAVIGALLQPVLGALIGLL